MNKALTIGPLKRVLWGGRDNITPNATKAQLFIAAFFQKMMLFTMRPAVTLIISMTLYMNHPAVDVHCLHGALFPIASLTGLQCRAFLSWSQDKCDSQTRPEVMVSAY